MTKKNSYNDFMKMWKYIQNHYYKSAIQQDEQKKQLEKEFFISTKAMDLDFKKWLTTIPKKAREEHLSNYEKKVKIELNTHKIQRKTVQIKKTKWILEQISFWKENHSVIKFNENLSSELHTEKNYFTYNGDDKQLKMIFDFLCKSEFRNKTYHFIKNTNFDTFKNVITGNSVKDKVNWNSYINSLKYFINKMSSKNLLEGSNLWILTADAFLVKNKSFTNKKISNKTKPSLTITNIIDSLFIKIERIKNN